MANSTAKMFFMFAILNLTITGIQEFTEPDANIIDWLEVGIFDTAQTTTQEFGEQTNENDYVSPQGETILVPTGGINWITWVTMIVGLVINLFFGTLIVLTSTIITGGASGLLLGITWLFTILIMLLYLYGVIKLYILFKNGGTD